MKREKQNARQKLADVAPLKAPFVIYIDPCGACNLKCRFCPCNNSDYKKTERHAMMDFALFEKIADDIADFDGRVKVIYLFCFGEPLLNPMLPDMIRVLKRRNLCREVRVVTNGVLLNPVLNDRLISAGVDLVRVSVEALSEIGYREIAGIDIHYDQFLSNIKDLHDKTASGGVVSAKIIAAGLNGRADAQLFEDTYRDITDNYFIEAEQNFWVGYDVSGKTADGAKSETMETDSTDLTCSYPLTHLVIYSNGKAGVCCGDWRMDNIVGDAAKSPLKDIWRGEPIRHMREGLLKGDRKAFAGCANCLRKSPDFIANDAETILAKLRREG